MAVTKNALAAQAGKAARPSYGSETMGMSGGYGVYGDVTQQQQWEMNEGMSKQIDVLREQAQAQQQSQPFIYPDTGQSGTWGEIVEMPPLVNVTTELIDAVGSRMDAMDKKIESLMTLIELLIDKKARHGLDVILETVEA